MPGLGDHQPAVRVLDVAQKVDVAPRVIESHDRRPDQGGTAEREQVVGRVVEQHRDMARADCGKTIGEQRRETARLREVLGVGPTGGAEADREPVAVDLGVAPKQGRRVLGDERRLTGRRGGARGRS